MPRSRANSIARRARSGFRTARTGSEPPPPPDETAARSVPVEITEAAFSTSDLVVDLEEAHRAGRDCLSIQLRDEQVQPFGSGVDASEVQHEVAVPGFPPSLSRGSREQLLFAGSDAVGADGDRDAAGRAGEGFVFAVAADVADILEVPGDRAGTGRIAADEREGSQIGGLGPHLDREDEAAQHLLVCF